MCIPYEHMAKNILEDSTDRRVNRLTRYIIECIAWRSVATIEFTSLSMQPVVTPSYSTALPIPSVVEFKPSQVRELLLRHRVRASVVQVGVGGMPYCGKSTLVCNMLELGSTSLQVHTHTLAHTHTLEVQELAS